MNSSSLSPVGLTWESTDSKIAQFIRTFNRQCLNAYREHPVLIQEHANIERSTAHGGYGRRQLYELVQNGADSMLAGTGGRIHVVLTKNALYCANEGEPIDQAGVESILTSHISKKRGSEIGRFGLGFKSVLAVTLRPEVYSRTGSFCFDPKDAEKQIRAVVDHPPQRFPYLRIAEPVDPMAAADQDPTLASLMPWSSTIIKLPLDLEDAHWLPEDVAEFPKEFLLFCPHVTGLTLEDRTRSLRREIRLQRRDGMMALEEGEDAAVWKVFETTHTPSPAARLDGGELADRESLPLMWAVPTQGRSARGVFWAFFPTEYFTTLSGIVNAPWKTNEDRQNLLTGPFNQELIEAAAGLISKSLPELVEPADPGRYLDLLPARGREAPNWADDELTQAVYRTAAQVPCLPDQNAQLRLPSEVKLHPAGLPKEALEAWSAYPNRPTGWCHASIENRERRSRAERLADIAGYVPFQVPAWLEALVKDKTAAASQAALKAAALVAKACPQFRQHIETARIVLTAEGTLVAPKPGTVFIPSEENDPKARLTLIHPALARLDGTITALKELGIGEVDASSELQSLLTSLSFYAMTDVDWKRLWSLVRRLPSDQSLQLLRDRQASHAVVKVRTLDGQFQPVNKVLLPGSIVPDDGSRDKAATIDVAFHKSELLVLKELGAVVGPTPNGGSSTEPWFLNYREAAIDAFLKRLSGRRPQRGFLAFDKQQTIGPLQPLFSLTEEGKAKFTETMLTLSADEEPWVMAHVTQPDRYGSISWDPPALWLAKRDGRLKTTLGIKPVPACVSPALLPWSELLPVAECGEELALRLGLPSTLQALTPEHWARTQSLAPTLTEPTLLAAFYAAASPTVPAPDSIPCRVGPGWESRAPSRITIVSAKGQAQALEKLKVPFLLATPEDAKTLCRNWKTLPAETHIKNEIYPVSSGAELLLLDQYPGLQHKLDPDLQNLKLVPCSSLRVESRTNGFKQSEDHALVREGNTIYYTETLDNAQLLDQLSETLNLPLETAEKQRILDYARLVESRQLTHAVRKEPTLHGKLLKAVGAEAIRRRLPAGLVEAYQDQKGRLSDKKAAELIFAIYGVGTLHAFRNELEQNGLTPPASWAGGHSARTFVKSLGFPTEYAGFEQGRREPTLEVEGPPLLPPLHKFQVTVMEEISRLPKRNDGRRGLLSLPTGAGKTRVAVEALISLIKREGPKGPILWVAQSDELCEQAVQTWSYVWRALGPQSPLVINRLWASNEADPVTDSAQVVVATIQKLQYCIDDPAYEWLAKETSWVLIDEAHVAIEKSYTRLLDWLGLGRGADRRPVIGLTATPFRGGEEETKRLVNRFGGHRLDRDAFGPDPYRELQDMGVLAKVDHQLLAGATIGLDEKELEVLNRTRLLPAAAGERLGANVSRNELLLKTIRTFPKDWPVLLFATSVDHAQTMAALLTLDGISAAAISAYTEPGARRYYIEAFRKGQLRVLTNFAVLTAGFDAPSVRAIIVARPTYSPVLYQQMIGRGLRGPKNGGKERCQIVNVKDNIRQYGEELAFTQFEYLWNTK